MRVEEKREKNGKEKEMEERKMDWIEVEKMKDMKNIRKLMNGIVEIRIWKFENLNEKGNV